MGPKRVRYSEVPLYNGVSDEIPSETDISYSHGKISDYIYLFDGPSVSHCVS